MALDLSTVSEKERYVGEMVLYSYPSAGKIKSIVPINLDWLSLAQQIQAGRNFFFGKFVCNPLLFLQKLPSFFSPAYLLQYNNLWLSCNGLWKIPLMGPLVGTDVITEYNDMLFDDLGFPLDTPFTQSDVGSINGYNTTLPYFSISVLVPNSNSGTLVNTCFATVLASNPEFIYAPNVFYFTGYKVIMEQ